MATLILDELKCDEETHEEGDDSPYFVFFVGSPSFPNAANLVRVRQQHWDNDVARGDLLRPGASVATVHSNTLVLCALMEEDDNKDFESGNAALKNVREHLRSELRAHAASGSVSNAKLATQLIPQMRKALSTQATHDDLVAIVHIPTDINLAAHGSFAFQSDGAHYKAWFKTV